MAEWLAPFHRPRLTDEEFRKRKAEYVAKYGYTITIPGLSDIIKVGTEKKITTEEEKAYHAKDWKYFSEERLEDIRKMKQKRKDRYLAMLASPTPQIVNNAGSLLTALDDCQDAMDTFSCVAIMARIAAPRILGKVFMGPVGWALAATEIVNAVQMLGRMAMSPMVSKRTGEKMTRVNPFTKKAKVARAMRLRRLMPTKGNVVQALQTTKEIFGVGLCLGPLVGLANDITFGTVRTTFKKPPKIKFPKPDIEHWAKAAPRVAKAVGMLWGAPWGTDDDMLLEVFIAGYYAHQVLLPVQQDWNPLDAVEDPHKLIIQAPVPWHPLTREVIEEEGKPMGEVLGWPHSGALWAETEEISNESEAIASENLRNFMERNKHNWRGFAGGALASETAFLSLANLEGEEDVEYDYTAPSKFMVIMLQNGLYPNPDQPAEKIAELADWLEHLERTGLKPTLKNIEAFCADQHIGLSAFS